MAAPSTPVLTVRRSWPAVATGPVGLEVHPGDELVAEEEGEYVVTEPTLWLGYVDLDSVVEAEEPLGARSEPDERVERGQQRPGVHPPSERDLRVQVGGLGPSFDRDLG